MEARRLFIDFIFISPNKRIFLVWYRHGGRKEEQIEYYSLTTYNALKSRICHYVSTITKCRILYPPNCPHFELLRLLR